MNTTKLTILSVAVLTMLSMLLFLFKFLLRRKRNNSVQEFITLSSCIWFITFFFSGTALINKTIAALGEAFENIYKINSLDTELSLFKIGSLFCGLTILWLMIWYFLSNTLTTIITGRRSIIHEAEANNFTYFLIRGAIHIGFIICLLSVFESILRIFIPQIEVPFYH